MHVKCKLKNQTNTEKSTVKSRHSTCFPNTSRLPDTIPLFEALLKRTTGLKK